MECNGVTYKKVGAGNFLMGTAFSEDKILKLAREYQIFPDWIVKEFPQREIYLDEFYVSENLVTFESMLEFVNDNPHYKQHQVVKSAEKYPINFPAFPIDINLAQDYCKWLSLKTNKCVRIPTEQQWEKAARGPFGNEYPWGNFDDGPVNIRNTGKAIPSLDLQYLNTSYFGVKMMAGNLEELTSSCNSFYEGLEIDCPDFLKYQVLRGGTCEHDLDLARCARRHGKIPSQFTGLRPIVSTSFEQKEIIKPYDGPRVGTFSACEITNHEEDIVWVTFGNSTKGYFFKSDLSEIDNHVFTRFNGIGSEIIVKIESFDNGIFNCRKSRVEDFKNLLSFGTN